MPECVGASYGRVDRADDRDEARKGGEEYGYRLRISAPEPDFELRVVPSSVSLPLNSTAAVTVHALRRDGFTSPSN